MSLSLQNPSKLSIRFWFERKGLTSRFTILGGSGEDTTRKKEGDCEPPSVHTTCHQGHHPRTIPLPLPQMETSYSNLSFRRKLQRGKQNWLERPRSKRAKDLTSSKPWTSPAHCNVLAEWHSRGRHDSWLHHSNHEKSPGKDWKGELYPFWVQTTPLFLDK